MATRALAASNGLTSAESEALNQEFSYLADSMDTTALLQPSMGRKLITARQRSECANESDPYKKAELFLGHLQRKVNGDCDKFHTFVQMLQETNQGKLCDKLKTRYKQLTTAAEVKSPTANVASADEQNQHKIFNKRTREVVTEAANTGSFRSQKRKKLEEDGFEQKSDDTQRGAPTQEEKTENIGIGQCQVCSFVQQTQKNFSQHTKGIQDLKKCTKQLQKDTKMNRETLDKMHKDLSETKKVVEQMEQKHMQPNDQLMEMMRQMYEREPCWFTDFKNKQSQ